GRDRKAERRSAAGGEEDDRRTGRGEGGRGDGVVARRLEQAEAAPPHAFAIAKHVIERRVAGFLHRPERLLLERRDAAGEVAGRGILGNRLTAGEEVALEVVDHADQ